MPPRHPVQIGAYALVAALLGGGAIAIDLWGTLARARSGHLAFALYDYFRFFTIETNVFSAGLMAMTAYRALRGGVLPAAGWFRAQLVYLVVTGATYELLLRHLWSPHGWRFVTDMTFHDIEPLLIVLFWVAYAPKDLRWRDLPLLPLYPLLYFAATLLAGALGAGYPYNFFDVAKLGYPAVIAIGFGFLGVFVALGALATAIARAMTGIGGPRRADAAA